MLTAEIEGDTIVLVSDDAEAENARLGGFDEGDLGDMNPGIAQRASDEPLGEDGKLRVEVLPDEFEGVLLWLEEFCYASPAHKALEYHRQEKAGETSEAKEAAEKAAAEAEEKAAAEAREIEEAEAEAEADAE